MPGARPTEATIDLEAVRHNLAEAERRAAGRQLIAVVKADAYGHGALAVAGALVEAGCPRLATLSVAEAVPLRDAGLTVPILVLGGVHDAQEAEEAAARALTPTLHQVEQIPWLAAAAAARGAPLPVHVEIDTGMLRMGVAPDLAVQLLERVAGEPGLRLDGVYTHLARGDEADAKPSLDQYARFRQLLAEARSRGVALGLIHAAHSAALLGGSALREALPEERAVRPGLMLYGVLPAAHLAARLRPVMTLRTRVVQVRRAAAGEAVGYAALYRARRDTRIATLAIGYADGVPVALSGSGMVLIRGRRRPIAGRISMDYVTVEVGDEAVETGDEAVLFGEGAGGRLGVEEVAAMAGTIPYELLVRVGPRVPRVVVG